jgi:hypothetical protein
MRRALIAMLLAGAVAVSTTRPAEARWGWGGWGGGGGRGHRRIRHRRTDRRGAVAAGLQLLLSGLWLRVRLPGL